MTRQGTIGKSISLGIKFYQNGDLYDPYEITSVGIYTAESGGTLVAALSATRLSTGYYVATWNIPSSYTATTLYDQWVWQAESTMATNTQTYSFDIVPESIYVEPPSVVRADVGCRAKPTWEFYVGLRMVEDVGNGTGLRLSWGDAIPNNPDNLIHYN